MEETDRELATRVRDIVAVVTNDIDTISVAVEDRVAYIEGVVDHEQQRQVIINAVEKVPGLSRVITCLATEHVLPRKNTKRGSSYAPMQVVMHYHSLS